MEYTLLLAANITPDKRLKDLYFRIKKLFSKERVKFYPLDQLLLIIRYIGTVPVEFISELNRIIAPIITNIPKTQLEINGIDIYPYDVMPRVLWLRIKENPVLTKLAKELESVITDFTGHKEDFSFYPHITFARIRFLNNLNLIKQLKDFQEIAPIIYPLNEIILYQVETSKQGNIYTVRNRFILK